MSYRTESFKSIYVENSLHSVLKSYCLKNSLQITKLVNNVLLEFLLKQGVDCSSTSDYFWKPRLNSYLERRAKEMELFKVEIPATKQIQKILEKQAADRKLFEDFEKFEAKEEQKGEENKPIS